MQGASGLSAAALLALALRGAKPALSRRGLLRAGAAAGLAAGATVALPAAPALAKSKSSLAQERAAGSVGKAERQNPDFKQQEAFKYKEKGIRGVAPESFDKNDTVQRNRDVNGGLARDAQGRKIVNANRQRDPAELGLKQWDGS